MFKKLFLLAVRQSKDLLDAWHVEVQASFRPIGYICPLAADLVPSFAKSKTSAKERSPDIIEPSVTAWLEKKFFSTVKENMRNSKWPNVNWNYYFVHAKVRESLELELMRQAGIQTISLHTILGDLQHLAGQITGGAGTDLAELIEYYNASYDA